MIVVLTEPTPRIALAEPLPTVAVRFSVPEPVPVAVNSPELEIEPRLESLSSR